MLPTPFVAVTLLAALHRVAAARDLSRAIIVTDNECGGGNLEYHPNIASVQACYQIAAKNTAAVGFMFDSGACYIKGEGQCEKSILKSVSIGRVSGYFGSNCKQVQCGDKVVKPKYTSCSVYINPAHQGGTGHMAKRDQNRLQRQLDAADSSGCADANKSVCPSEFDDGSKGGHSCFNLQTDFENCGSCGHDCSDYLPEGAQEALCVKGQCVASSCLPGYRHSKKGNKGRGSCRPEAPAKRHTVHKNRRADALKAHRLSLRE